MFLKPSSLNEQVGTDLVQREVQRVDPGILSFLEDLLKGGSDLRVRVTGRSMTPFLRGGEVLTLRRVESSSLKRGDLIFFRGRDGYPILHRLIQTIRRKSGAIDFQTKGDALIAFDEPVQQHDVLAKVCIIEKGTKSIDLETGIWNRLNGLIAVMSLFRTRLSFTLHALRNLV